MASSARLDELKKKFDENPRRYFAPLANEHRKSGDLDQAIALCRTHLPQQPGHISGHIVLAQALFETGSLEESREIFHTALGLDPENLIALRYLGDIAKEASDIETARQWYHRVLEVDPRNDEIVQLIRDLDAPPPETREHAEAGEPVTAPAEAPSAYAPPPEPSAADSDARFAPLSLDDLDVNEQARPAASSPNEYASPAQAQGSAEWGAEGQGTDLSMLDAAGIDPFDLDPAGTVESLLDAHNQEAATEDFFLTELAGSNAPKDGSLPDPASTWAADESRAPDASAAPEPTESAASTDAAFDDGAFYLEPPPPEPVAAAADSDAMAPAAQADATPQSAVERDQVSMPGLDAFVAEYSVPEPGRPASTAAASTFAPKAEASPNAEDLARFAAQETHEWQPPAPPMTPASSAPDDGLGLEVMEFVPPPREPSLPVSASAPSADADPILGRTLDMASADRGDTPAAFVTETMAELYLQQGFRNEALAVYRELLARNPSDANLRDRIDQIESGSLSSIGMAAVSENVVESAIKRQHARSTRSVRSFFASLAGRRAPTPRDDGFYDVEGAQVASTQDTSAAAESSAAPELGTEPEQSASDMLDDAGSEPTFDSNLATSFDASLAENHWITPPVSAAETLTTFDPFADAAESAIRDSAPDTPNEDPGAPPVASIDQIDSTDLSAWSAPTAEMPTPQQAPAAPTSNVTPARRSLEDLFPETPVTPRTEAAAQTFATAFGRSEPQGRPTRAASNELSLDNVFRGTPEGAPPENSGFSFDQFFSDSRSPGTDPTAQATTTQETGRNNGSGEPHDIEQFTAWLEGLKKK